MLGLKTFFISPYGGDYFQNYNNIVSDLIFLCFNGVCNEETMVFPKRRNITPMWTVACTRFSLRSLCSPRSSSFWLSSWSCRFFINANCSLVSARSWAYDQKLIMNLISVLCQVVPQMKDPTKWTLHSQQWSFLTGCIKTLRQHSMMLICQISDFSAVC